MAKKTILEEEFGEDHALESILKELNKQYGTGSVMMLGESPTMNIEAIHSGSIALDQALGIGGYPKGRIVEIYGPESSGKTTLAIHAVAEAQKMGLKAAYIDAEHAFDREYASNLGVNVDSLLFAQPDCGEDCLDIATKLISTGKIGVCVIDSVAALTPKAEIDGAMGEARIGLQARLMSQALRKMTGIISKTNCLCIFINQIREKIGVMFGNPETTTGGNALKFYASIRVEVRKSTSIKDGEDAVANLTKIKIVKNKVAPPFRKAEFEIEYGKGINRVAEIADMSVEYDIIHKSGSWFSYEDAKICQGRNALLNLFRENNEFYEEIEQLVRDRISNNKDDESLKNLLS
ncbi:MAG: recombinase RecA [Clostridia bacterium]|nr:recombinase RecA [Clostridia bacterium]